MNCRHCQTPLHIPFIDLGCAPPSNAYLTRDKLTAPETWYPLRVLVCEHCWLVQTEDFARAETFFNDEYAYFSSYSSTWLAHSKRYANEMIDRFGLTASNTHVVEIAANDGYLLQYFTERNIPCTGIEPTASTAEAARQKGITIIEDFFGCRLAGILTTQGKQADLMVANNVLAHVPDINDFVRGFAQVLKPKGVATFEFPHLLRLVSGNQFDTIYHEHFSYLSLTSVSRIFSQNGLVIFDVEELPTHGGSLRIFAQRKDTGRRKLEACMDTLLETEKAAGLMRQDYYTGFQSRAVQIKNDFLAFLLQAKSRGKTVAGYGAAAKGNTLLNFAGIKPDLMQFICDAAPSKQGRFMPGSRIPILPPQELSSRKPDFVVILPWNIRDEITKQLAYIEQWGGVFVTAVPTLCIGQKTR